MVKNVKKWWKLMVIVRKFLPASDAQKKISVRRFRVFSVRTLSVLPTLFYTEVSILTLKTLPWLLVVTWCYSFLRKAAARVVGQVIKWQFRILRKHVPWTCRDALPKRNIKTPFCSILHSSKHPSVLYC